MRVLHSTHSKVSRFITVHYIDVKMTTMASQITSLTVVYSTVYSDADQRKHQSSASLAFVWGIHRDRWIPRTKGQLRGKCFHLMTSSCDARDVFVAAIMQMLVNNISPFMCFKNFWWFAPLHLCINVNPNHKYYDITIPRHTISYRCLFLFSPVIICVNCRIIHYCNEWGPRPTRATCVRCVYCE